MKVQREACMNKAADYRSKRDILDGLREPAGAGAMICSQVTGNDTAVAVADQSGNVQFNTLLPVIACNLLQGMKLPAGGAHSPARLRILCRGAFRGCQPSRPDPCSRRHCA